MRGSEWQQEDDMKKQDVRGRRAFTVMGMMLAAGGLVNAQETRTPKGEPQVTVSASKFYCNVGALNAAERVRHKELTDKLLRLREEIVESEKGYEFQYSPKDVSVAEVAEWVVAESKCCPFFDFHIDLENEGQLVCLRLTGAEGVKAFVRSEFAAGKK
jgi:hypothetical protein